MSVPTMRTPRSPFARSARSRAAVPGAPEAVTRTVMSRIGRAMLLTRRVDAAPDQLDQALGVDRKIERTRQRNAVRHDVDEQHDVLALHVVPERPVLDVAREPGFELGFAFLAPALLELLHQLGIAAQKTEHLEVDRHPVRALLREVPDGGLEAVLHQEGGQLVLVARREFEEQRPLVREVVEDRAAREPDLLLQASDRGAVVAVAGERAARPVQDLLPPGLEMLCRDLRHGLTLQNRTYVLLFLTG